MEEIALLAEVVMEVMGETVRLGKAVTGVMEGIANKAPVEMVGMGATVLEEEEKEDLVELDLKGMERMETMETRDNQDKRT